MFALTALAAVQNQRAVHNNRCNRLGPTMAKEQLLVAAPLDERSVNMSTIQYPLLFVCRSEGLLYRIL